MVTVTALRCSGFGKLICVCAEVIATLGVVMTVAVVVVRVTVVVVCGVCDTEGCRGLLRFFAACGFGCSCCGRVTVCCTVR